MVITGLSFVLSSNRQKDTQAIDGNFHRIPVFKHFFKLPFQTGFPQQKAWGRFRGIRPGIVVGSIPWLQPEAYVQT